MKELKIKNYKCLKSVLITDLKRVNLLTGKNNTGKSSILEAISIKISEGDLRWIYEILLRREEIVSYRGSDNEITSNINLALLSSLFQDRNISFSNEGGFSISDQNAETKFQFVNYLDEITREKDGEDTSVLKTRKILSDKEDNPEAQIGLKITNGQNYSIIDLNKNVLQKRSFRTNGYNFHLIDSKGDDIIRNADLWDKISLSEKEDMVIESLRIIEPNISRLSFVGEDNFRNRRYPIVKLSDSENIYPLKAMGDGINRILNLILALVNAANGVLLVDEIENGLHYSVQEQLWEIIFSLSEKLNIQIFASTHSNDTICAFANVLEKHAQYDGNIYRLQRKDDRIICRDYSKDEITHASKININLR